MTADKAEEKTSERGKTHVITKRKARRTKNGTQITIQITLEARETFCDLAEELRSEANKAERAFMAPYLVMEYLVDILEQML